MGDPKSIAQSYRDSMRRHRFGYALYEPAPFSRLRPGMLGYLDDDHQRWHPILDLTDADAVAEAGYTPLGHLQPSGGGQPDVRRLGPLTADRVHKTELALEAGLGAGALAAAGLPVDVGAAVRYSTSGEFGAVLLCRGDVVSEGFDFREPFLAWLQVNAKVLFRRYPDARKRGSGLCVATWTYSAEDIGIAAWESSEGGVAVGCEVGMAEVAKLGPNVEWIRGRSSSGWAEWKDQKRVVFFAGVKIKPGIFGVMMREEREEDWRGGADEDMFEVEDEEEEGGAYMVGVEMFGDDWDSILNGDRLEGKNHDEGRDGGNPAY